MPNIKFRPLLGSLRAREVCMYKVSRSRLCQLTASTCSCLSCTYSRTTEGRVHRPSDTITSVMFIFLVSDATHLLQGETRDMIPRDPSVNFASAGSIRQGRYHVQSVHRRWVLMSRQTGVAKSISPSLFATFPRSTFSRQVSWPA